MKNQILFMVLGLGFCLILSFLGGDAFGVLFSFLLFLLPLCLKTFRKNRRLLLLMILALTLRQIASYTNVFLVHIPGAYEDAYRYHRVAAGELIEEGDWSLTAGSGLMVRMLTVLYSLFGSSLLLAQQMAIFSYILSALILLKIAEKLGFKRFHTGIFVLFSFIPVMIFWGSANMREPWQIFFFLASCLCILNFNEKGTVKRFFLLVPPMFLLALFQNTLIPFSMLLFACGLFWGLKLDKKITRYGIKFSVTLILIVFLALGGLLGSKLITVVSVFRWGAELDAIAAKGQSNYGGIINVIPPKGQPFTPPSTAMAALKFPLIPFGYMFYPLPFQVKRPIDLYAMLESCLRLVLLFFAFLAWRKARRGLQRKLGFLAFAFLVMEFMWSLGTISWFTGMRHHMPAYGLLVLLGGPGFLVFFRKFLPKKQRGSESFAIKEQQTS